MGVRLVWDELAAVGPAGGGVLAAEVEPFGDWEGARALTEVPEPDEVGRLALLLRLEPKPRLFSRELIASTWRKEREKWEVVR